MSIKTILKLEGALVFVTSIYFYFQMSGNLWMLILLLLVPDVFMIGYKKNNIIGARVYNLAHTYIIPGVLIFAGYKLNIKSLIYLGLIWSTHIGMDRLMGYGLKKDSGFKDTHIS